MQETPTAASRVHQIRTKVLCDTEGRGYATPENRSPLEIVLDASEGFVPLWAEGVTLRWRFQERSLQALDDPEGTRAAITDLLAAALLAWGPAVPLRFTHDPRNWDFEIVARRFDDCTPSGCVLASAFFPDGGRHQLVVHPRMFQQSRKEQVDTVVHELGHTFGLRHFFAALSESAWPSEVFGLHRAFSIMNYGADSELTDDDRSDLARLYDLVWSGRLTAINGTPVRLVLPFTALGGTAPVTTAPVVAAAVRSRCGCGPASDPRTGSVGSSSANGPYGLVGAGPTPPVRSPSTSA